MSVVLSGVTVTVHINSSGDVDEQQLADTLNAGAAAANKCEPTIASLVRQYEQTSVDAERANIEDRIREIYREALIRCLSTESVIIVSKIADTFDTASCPPGSCA